MQRLSVLILAKGSSNGLPRKNLQKIQGMTLVEIAVRQAFNLVEHSQVYVSSDSDLIFDAIKNLGVQMINRPPDLATPEASAVDCVKHALRYIKTDHVAILPPTHPIRETAHIAAHLESFYQSGKQCGFSGVEFHGFTYDEKLKPIGRALGERSNRQQLPKTYIETGAFYIMNRNVLQASDIIFDEPFVFPGCDGVDIHTRQDLERARLLFSPQWLDR